MSRTVEDDSEDLFESLQLYIVKLSIVAFKGYRIAFRYKHKKTVGLVVTIG